MSAVSTKTAGPSTATPSRAPAAPERLMGPCNPLDTAPVEDIVSAMTELPIFPTRRDLRTQHRRFTTALLHRLKAEPGRTWQERWESLEALHGGTWNDAIDADLAQSLRGSALVGTDRFHFASALGLLVQVRLLRPSYPFLQAFRTRTLYAGVRSLHTPELFAQAAQLGEDHGMIPSQASRALKVLTTIVIHTGKELSDLTSEDLLDFRERTPRAGKYGHFGLHSAWHLLVLLGQIEAGSSLDAVSKPGQRPTAELVDRYRIKSNPIRGVLIRYLDEQRPSMDYNTFLGDVIALAKLFWADVEQHHPGIDTLDLPEEAAAAWKERIRYVVRKGQRKPRKTAYDTLMKVRAFYLDIAEWALEDPSWAAWAVPSPVRRSDTAGLGKVVKARKAEIHQRIRERLPHLPKMVEAAEDWKSETAALLAAVKQVAVDDEFDLDGRQYRRIDTAGSRSRTSAWRGRTRLLAADLATGEIINAERQEEQAFWAWACVETFRHTGIRIEELLELTHLALVSYRLPDTGEVVPLLQIVPSKNGEERLLLVTPELSSVLASIVQRIRSPEGTIPLVARYDPHERTTGPELPHLFQRQVNWRRRVINVNMVGNLLKMVLERTGLTDSAGHPLYCTAHDFRRMFSTEAVTGGLPIHIAAKILGHANINTTEGYTAVFQDDLIRAYRTFVDRRRAERPSEEYREPTAEEWIEFQQHFALRKLELGDCGRPYGSPCQHEHACVRCPMLRVDPRAKGRLQEIIANLTERIEEARASGWLGEIEGLKTSQAAAIAKLASLNRAERNKPGTTSLSMPTVRRVR